ncbi:MAG TPA: FxsA family protein [Solirubrobacteraceae bacterium]
MFVILLILWPVAELFAFIEVGLAIGWLATIVLLLATSVLGWRLLRIQGRTAIERVSLAVSEHRAPAPAAIDGALGFLGAALLVLPGFITDVLGGVLLLRPIRTLARRWLAAHYAGRVIGYVVTAGRFAGARPASRPADVDSTAVEHEPEQLGP